MQSIKGAAVTMIMNTLSDKGSSYMADVDSVVPPEILARVFKDEQLPFQTNSDGSVEMIVYLSWLDDTWKKALEEFEEHFDSVEHRRVD